MHTDQVYIIFFLSLTIILLHTHYSINLQRIYKWCLVQFRHFPIYTHLMQLISYLSGLGGVSERGNRQTVLDSNPPAQETEGVTSEQSR